MKNEELIALIKNDVNVAENMLALYQQNKGMLCRIARRYESIAELDDLLQESYIGLVVAVEGYNPDIATSFTTYAWKVVKSHLVRYIRNNKNIPEYMQYLVHQYEKMENAFLVYLGRKPTAWEYCQNLDVSEKQLIEIRKSQRMGQMESLDVPNEEGFTMADNLQGNVDIESEVLERVNQEYLEKELWKAVDELPGIFPELIQKRYKDNMIVKDIARLMGMTHSQARTQETMALKQLRRNKIVSSYKDEYIANKAMQGNGVERFRRTWTSSTERVALGIRD